MGEKTLADEREPNFLMIQESKARCTSQFGRERFIVQGLFQASSDESLNQRNVSLLQRIDRLDSILSVMEEKTPSEPSGDSFRSLNGSRRISPYALEKRCKSTESVLEEVEEKGTLVERVSELETRLAKLEQIILKSNDNVALHTIPSYDRTSHDNEDEESLQDDVDVEKHEVIPSSDAPIEPPEVEQHQDPLLPYSEKLDISPRKEELSKHIEALQGMASSEGAAMDNEDSRARLQKSKRKTQIRKWLLKQLHMGSTSRQVENL